MADLPINLEVCETFCNEKQVYPAMKYLVEEKGMTPNAAGNKVEEITKGRVTANRARHVYRGRTPAPEKVGGTANSNKDPKPKEVQIPAETKIKLSDVQDAIKHNEISDDDLKVIVDTVADSVEKGEASPRVLSKSKTVFKKSARDYGPPKEKKESDIIKMVNSFHTFLAKLDAVRGKGTANISKADRDTMDNEFKLMVPRLLRLLDWMGIDLQALLTNYVNHFKEVQHENQAVKRLVGD